MTWHKKEQNCDGNECSINYYPMSISPQSRENGHFWTTLAAAKVAAAAEKFEPQIVQKRLTPLSVAAL